LNKRRQAIQKGWVIPPSAPRLDERVRRRVNRWLPMRYDGMKGLPEATIAVYPTHTERRISTQRSCFTIHGKDCGALDDLWNAGSRCLAKIKIPAWSVQQIKRELGGAGIDEATIFPDLSGLSRTIAARWKPDGNPHPHQKVYTRVRPSKIHGVGVFALVKIKKGTPLFEGESPEMPWFEKKSLPREPHAIRMLYNDFAAIDPEDRYGCPRSFNCLTPAWYLNEPKPGDRPNVNCDPETFEFTAAESIEPGVELTVSYRTYSSVPPSKSKKT
jgi:hypothetical protein